MNQIPFRVKVKFTRVVPIKKSSLYKCDTMTARESMHLLSLSCRSVTRYKLCEIRDVQCLVWRISSASSYLAQKISQDSSAAGMFRFFSSIFAD